MAENSKIGWCDNTFNPWIGCTKCSPGCDNCYAERDFGPKSRHPMGGWGAGKERYRTSEANWKKPLAWNRKAQRDNKRCKVFAGSLCDIFDEEVSSSWMTEFLFLIDETKNLDWLVLTKRPDNARKWLGSEPFMRAVTWKSNWKWPLPNLWLGVTVCNQAEADAKIPVLLDTPAAGRFVSVEPMLGPVDLTKIRFDTPNELPGHHHWYLDAVVGCISPAEKIPGCVVGRSGCTKLDWVIAGGETGPNARPVHPDWVRSLRDQCAEGKDVGNDIPFFFKQWGEWMPTFEGIDPCKNDPECSVRESMMFPDDKLMWRVGRKGAGCLLDDKKYKEFPEGLK